MFFSVCLAYLCMYTPLSQQQNCPLTPQTLCVYSNNFIRVLLAWQHINHSDVRLPFPTLAHKLALLCHHATTVMLGESFVSKAGLTLIKGNEILGSALYVFGDNQESKKADCCRQFDHPLLGMGSPLRDWNRPLPGGLRPHWTGEVGMVIICWANPKSLPISLFPTCRCSILDMSLATPILFQVAILLLVFVSWFINVFILCCHVGFVICSLKH